MNRQLAEQRFQSAVRRAMHEAEPAARQQAGDLPVELRSIDAVALRERAQWQGQQWNWEAQIDAIKGDPRRFSLAIWVEGTLCGLALGKLAKSGKSVNVMLLEGNPDRSHPLKGQIVPITALFGFALCEENGSKELRFVQPLEGVKALYEAYGFSLETPPSGVPYMIKRYDYGSASSEEESNEG